MIKAIISDFSRVLLFPKDSTYEGGLNLLHKELTQTTDYNPLNHFQLNTELLDFYKSLKETYDLYIFTSDVIQDAVEFQSYLQPVFKGIFSAAKMNNNKKEASAYQKIVTELNLKPETILYIDDTSENIEAAKAAGLITIQYQNNEQIFNEIKKSLSS